MRSASCLVPKSPCEIGPRRPQVPRIVAPTIWGARQRNSLSPGRLLEMARKETAMEVVFERCCGLDVHKATVVVCLWMRDQWGKIHKEIKTFGTMTADLLVLSDWLRSQRGDPRSDGEHGGILEADLQSVGR